MQHLRAHSDLDTHEDLFLLPFTTLDDRDAVLSESGLINGLTCCVSALRNSQRVDGLSDFFVFVTRAYRAV